MLQMKLVGTTGFEKHNRATCEVAFEACMEMLVRGRFCAQIDPNYSKAGYGGSSIGFERFFTDNFLRSVSVRRL